LASNTLLEELCGCLAGQRLLVSRATKKLTGPVLSTRADGSFAGRCGSGLERTSISGYYDEPPDGPPNHCSQPMPHENEIAEVRQIFLSATAQDCLEYREAVRDVVQDNVPQGKVFLQENWAERGQFVVDVCRQRVRTSDAYMGLFGHRYGWQPPGHTRSITELEFRWAVERWPQRVAPIFILLPEKGSEADRLLHDWAAPYIEQECPGDAARCRHDQAQQAFLKAVGDWAADGRMLTFYGNRRQLEGKALSTIQNWNMDLLRQALVGRRRPAGDIPAEELGRLGREEQCEVLSEALEAFRERSGQRAIAFLVHGAENHGQREFAEFLCRCDEWDDCTPPLCGQPAEVDSVASLICWTCGQLQQPLLGSASIDTLAEALAARLERGSLVVVQRSAGRDADRLATFQREFWLPLHVALAGRAPRVPGRLYWFVIDHEALPANPAAPIRSSALDAGDVDYGQILALPALGEISARQVRNWLKELQGSAGIRLGEARRKEIAAHATAADGNPPNVYDRLLREGFWAQAN